MTVKKVYKSKDYNYLFDGHTGFFARWGKTLQDDPEWSPVGPEIADIEISTICHGVGAPCAFCYKANNPNGKNMTLETFKRLFAKLPKNLTQIAFGIGDIDSNPDMLAIFEYSRENNVIPNVTMNGARMTKHWAKRFAEVCGAVSVSRYHKDMTYDTVKLLTDAGLEQVNIHQLVADHTYETCLQLLKEVETDPRLEKLHATVFLAAKAKGRGTWLKPLELAKFKNLVAYSLEHGIKIGFDSCSAPKFLAAIKGHPQEKILSMSCEPCESGLFSAYINVDGEYYPCSFTEGEKEIRPINVLECDDFIDDVWNHPDTKMWRKRLLKGCRACPMFRV